MESSMELSAIEKIKENGNKAEEWWAFLNRVRQKSRDYKHVTRLYEKAASLIPPDEHRKSIWYARILVELGKLQGMTDPEEARDVFRIARCNVKRFAIVYLAWAQFELSLQENRRKCKSILNKGKTNAAEPLELLEKALRSCDEGKARLLDEETEELAFIGVVKEPGKSRVKLMIPALQSDSELTQEKRLTENQVLTLQGSDGSKRDDSSIILLSSKMLRGNSSSTSSSEDTEETDISRPSVSSLSTYKTSIKETPNCKSVDMSSLSNSTSSSVRKSARRGLKSNTLFLGPPLRAKNVSPLEDVEEDILEEDDNMDGIKVLDYTHSLLVHDKVFSEKKRYLAVNNTGIENTPSRVNLETNQPDNALKHHENVARSALQNKCHDNYFMDSNLENQDPRKNIPDQKKVSTNLQLHFQDIPRRENSNSTNQQWHCQDIPRHENSNSTNRQQHFQDIPRHENSNSTNRQQHCQDIPRHENSNSTNQQWHCQDIPRHENSYSQERSTNGSNYQRIGCSNQDSASYPVNVSSFVKQEAPVNQTLPQGQANNTIFVNGKSYLKLNTIGKGGSSKVFLAFDGQHVCAVKYVSLEDADDVIVQSYVNEIVMLKRLQDCDYIIKLYDWEQKKNENSIVLVLECGSIDLAAFLHKNRSALAPTDLIACWKQMLEAVNAIHSQGIIHNDLKPANFLFVEGRLKLIDFGIAISIQADQTSIQRDTQIGTLNYMSPETFQDISSSPRLATQGTESTRPCTKVGRPSDVWSLGCILYNMVYGRTPFQHITNLAKKVQCILADNYTIEFPPLHNQQLLDVLKGCLIRNPRKRYTIPELLEHPFVELGKTGNF